MSSFKSWVLGSCKAKNAIYFAFFWMTMAKVTVGGVQKVILHDEGRKGGERVQIPLKNVIICTTVLEGNPYEVFCNLFFTKTVQSTKQFGVAGLHRLTFGVL